MVNLNTLVLPGSGLTLIAAAYINDQGEIAGAGVLPNGDLRAVLLIPASPDEIAATANLPVASAAPSTSRGPAITSADSLSNNRNYLLNRFRGIRREP